MAYQGSQLRVLRPVRYAPLRARSRAREVPEQEIVNIEVRTMRDEDVPYLLQSWILQIQRYQQRSFRSLKAELRPLLHSSDVRVACCEDDEDAILGFAVIHKGQTLMVYTRATARGLGVQKKLFPRKKSPERKAA
jgi:hypothetical protein